MWFAFVELIRSVLLAVAHSCGGSIGGSIFIVSLTVRLAMIPLGLRLARRARANQAALAAIKPEMDRLQRTHATDPVRLYKEMAALRRTHGVRLFNPTSFAMIGVQLPLLNGLFAAVRSGLGAKQRFLWITDLATTDARLLVLATVFASAAAAMTPAAPGSPVAPRVAAIVAGATTLFFLWFLSSGVALSFVAGSVASAAQSLMLRRQIAREGRPTPR